MARKPDPRPHLRGRMVPVDDVVVATLEVLAGDEDQFHAFLSETGLDGAALREGLSQGSVQAGLLHFLVHNEALIVAVAQRLGRSPEDVASASLQMPGHRDEAGYF